KGGNDIVVYNLINSLTDPRGVVVTLGAGHDVFVAHIGGDILDPNGSFRVYWVQGDDLISFTAFGGYGVQIGAGLHIAITAVGGGGRDVVSAVYQGDNLGTLSLTLRGVVGTIA